MTKAVLGMLLALVTASSLMAQPQPSEVHIQRLTSAPVIDGNVSPEEWKEATRIERWWEVSPGNNIEPKVRTVAYIGYDARFLYVAYINYDPNPKAIRAPYDDRDNINDSTDFAGVILNPSDDKKTGIEFFSTPRGVQFDAINSDATGEDAAPDFYWDAAGKITPEGWTLEMRIPFTSLRYSAGREQTWRILFLRNYPRDRRYQIASQRIPQGSNCLICLLAPLTGLQDLPSSSHTIVAPYTTITRNEAPGTSNLNKQAGIDAKWTPNAHVAVDTTINPDFSQVESDVAAITTNQRFAVFYPEKRPFFLEGKDLFGTPIQAVYTREINSPRWGGRVTGTSAGTDYTVLVADDRGGGSVIISGPNSSSFAAADFASRNLIGRVRHDIGSSFVSFLVTDREIVGGGHNRVFGPDFLWRLGPYDNIQAQALYSDSLTPNRPDLAAEWTGQKLSSHAEQIDWRHSDPKFDGFLFLIDRGNEFRADLGFVPQVGTREAFGQGGYTFRPTTGFFSSIRPNVEADYTGQRDGALVYRFVSPGIELDGRWQSSTNLNLSFDRIRAGNQTLPRAQLHFDISASPSRLFQSVELKGQWGSDIDFENSRRGKGGTIEWNGEIRPTDHLAFVVNTAFSRLDLRDGGWLFTARVERLKATYNFSSRQFLRLIGQLVRTDRNVNLYPNVVDAHDASRSLSALYAFKVNWQTVLYLGYGTLDALSGQSVYSNSARQAFVKVSYAWQK